MKIQFVRSGGFAGLRLSLLVDTNELPAAEVVKLTELIESARTDLTDAPSPSAGPDQFEYQLTFDTPSGGREFYVLREPEVPHKVRPLIEKLTAMARRRAV